MSVKDDLIAAKALIDTPERWLRGNYHRKRGESHCFCAMGAVIAATTGDLDGLSYNCADRLDALRAALPDEYVLVDRFDISDFNDDPTTTHADIMALFDRAIAAASPAP